jgi:hypothetical protein
MICVTKTMNGRWRLKFKLYYKNGGQEPPSKDKIL